MKSKNQEDDVYTVWSLDEKWSSEAKWTRGRVLIEADLSDPDYQFSVRKSTAVRLNSLKIEFFFRLLSRPTKGPTIRVMWPLMKLHSLRRKNVNLPQLLQDLQLLQPLQLL